MKELIVTNGLADILDTIASAAAELSEESDTGDAADLISTIERPATPHDNMLSLAMTAGRLDNLVKELREPE